LGAALLVACGASERGTSGAGGREGAAGKGSSASAGAGTAGASGTGGAGGKGGTGGGGRGVVVVTEGGEGGGDCMRDVTLQAVVLGEPAPFDLIIVADHSKSLAWSRDELSAGLSTLLTNVEGRSVRVFLLTPTQYGASSAAARAPLSGAAIVPWQDPETGAPYEDAMTEYSQLCTDPADQPIDCPDPKGMTAYRVHGAWDFLMPEPLAVLTPDMTAAEFATEQVAVTDAILAIGGSGSPHEQPLCTLGRYVSQDPSKLPENAVFVVITDEDDVSLPEDCARSYDAELQQYKQIKSEADCTGDCNLYRWMMSGTDHWVQYPFTCAAYTDTGDLLPGTEQTSVYWIENRATCAGFTGRTCNDEDKLKVQAVCPAGLTLKDCEYTCVDMDTLCTVDLTDPSIDGCTEPFTYLELAAANLPAYCALRGGSGWTDCHVLGRHVEYDEYWQGGYSHAGLMQGSTTADVGAFFKSRVAAAFGVGKYLVEGILLDPSFSCILGSGQSYATNIAEVIGDPMHLFPLCASYAPALDGVLDFAQALIQSRFHLALKDDEHVTAVVIIAKDGSERTLPVADYTFDEATGTLDIDPSAIQGTDANLRVEVTSDCRPIVR
jgi:hypothetical protein